MLAIGIVLAILITYLTGGTLTNLESIKYHPYSKYVLVIFIIDICTKLIINLGILGVSNILTSLVPYYNIVLYLGLIVTLELNKTLKYVRLIESGLILNFLPIISNGGKMPVLKNSLVQIGADDRLAALLQNRMFSHSLVNADTRFQVLSDIIPIDIGLKTVVSIGDIVVVVGMILFIVHYSRNRN